MSKKVIYNCHNHLFTHENIPNGYFPVLIPLARFGPARWGLRLLLKGIIPWTKNDKMHRRAAFIKAAYRKNQEDNFKELIGYYPKGSKFIILPMDMAFMGAGKVKEGIDEQHSELAKLAVNPLYRDLVIPFAHIDPRRKDSLQRLIKLVEEHNFKGVKIYPTLGYKPSDDRLMDEIYPYMVQRGIPLLAHCSPGSVNSKDISKEDAHKMADPDNYISVMEKYPELKICLGHFGGIGEWKRHIDEPRNSNNTTWLTKILRLMKSGKYPNLYADISYTIFNFQENVPLLKILLEDEAVVGKVLFGSDFYMVENENYSEKRFSTDLRYSLGEELFWTIANKNPKQYLGE